MFQNHSLVCLGPEGSSVERFHADAGSSGFFFSFSVISKEQLAQLRALALNHRGLLTIGTFEREKGLIEFK